MLHFLWFDAYLFPVAFGIKTGQTETPMMIHAISHIDCDIGILALNFVRTQITEVFRHRKRIILESQGKRSRETKEIQREANEVNFGEETAEYTAAASPRHVLLTVRGVHGDG